ncbi:hypothetical protein PBSP11RLL_000505800, partial [Plasmodium berghei]
YNELLNELWDPDSNQYINKAYILIISMQFYNMFLEKIVRVYSPNLVMIQQRCKKLPWSRQKYFYAIAAKFKISENKTIFVMASANKYNELLNELWDPDSNQYINKAYVKNIQNINN